MVLHPIDSGNPTQQRGPQSLCSAWAVVEDKQKQPAQEWWLIAQPDHAALAGDLAALLETPLIPNLDELVLRAISLHDSGWARFDGGERGTGRELEISLREPQVDANGKPLSFLEMTPEQFVIAWEESIQRAAEVSVAGGAMVSQHFCRLTRSRLQSHQDSPQDKQHLEDFLGRQSERQAELLSKEAVAEQKLVLLTEVLQFCDLLSLYLCCGADDPVEFPQKFAGQSITTRRNHGIYETTPRLFGDGASLGVTARRFPNSDAVEVGTLAFLIQ
jgi:Protein of unknown function (DUF3891)